MKLFTKQSFDVFEVDGLDNRMDAIRSTIQPVFQEISDNLNNKLSDESGYEQEFHIAQHLRRTVNPPESTWCAFGGNNRGYKKYPHLQIQINPHYIFIGFAMIDNPKYEIEITKNLLSDSENWKKLSEDFKISKDHTKEKLIDFTNTNMETSLERVINVKKGEIMVGRIIENTSDLLDDEKEQLNFIKETYNRLMPLYKQSLDRHYELEDKAN